MTKHHLKPFPIRARRYGGESIHTYVRRLASRNHLDAADLDHDLRSRNIVSSRSPRCPERLAAWRAYGSLHASAFTEPDHVAGNWITDRLLCRQCCAGDTAVGRRPDVGMVCVRHRRWLGDTQRDVRAFPGALAAERVFRTYLVARQVPVGCYPMEAGLEYAALWVTPDEMAQRQHVTGIDDDQCLLYPETVRFARLVTSPAFLNVVADPDVPPLVRRREIERRVGHDPDRETWRIVHRLWTLSLRLHDVVAAAWEHGKCPVDDEYNLLRHTTLATKVPRDRSGRRGALYAVQPLAG